MDFALHPYLSVPIADFSGAMPCNSGHQSAPNYCRPIETASVTLQKQELWEQFHEMGTEMIITKSGRRMFPSIDVSISNLDPNVDYCVLVEMCLASNCRYKYVGKDGWKVGGEKEAQSNHRYYMHPDSPAKGQHWMSQNVSFGRLKLTNTKSPTSDQIILNSMHKYQPKIIICQTFDRKAIYYSPSKSFMYSETEFIAVTAYQNEKVTKLKIDRNPFAKGFRENGKSKYKRHTTPPPRDIDDNESPVDKRRLIDNESPASNTSGSDCEVLSLTPSASPTTHRPARPSSAHPLQVTSSTETATTTSVAATPFRRYVSLPAMRTCDSATFSTLPSSISDVTRTNYCYSSVPFHPSYTAAIYNASFWPSYYPYFIPHHQLLHPTSVAVRHLDISRPTIRLKKDFSIKSLIDCDR